jgi:hypothetical protein
MAEENKATVTPETNEMAAQATENKEAAKAPDYEAENVKLKAEIEKLKQAQTNASSDASRYKKLLQERMSEQERIEAERAEKEAQQAARIAELEKKDRIATYRSKFVGTGYDDATASALAEMLPEGVTEEFFDAQKAFLASYKQAIETNRLNQQPNLTAGMPPTAEDKKAAEDAKYRKWFGLA